MGKSEPIRTVEGASWLSGGGEMGKYIRAKDWSTTPLGPLETWPASLRTAVSIALNSSFPISIAWGPEHTQIYNDGYTPICAAKHPQAMGDDFSQCWASAFPVIGDAFRSALAGTTAFLEDQRMFLDRRGYLEETFFTFSFSPIFDEHGAVAGLFHPVTETTERMLAERRTRTLRDLATRGLDVTTVDGGVALVAEVLHQAAFDVPFALIYRLEEGTSALLAHAGLSGADLDTQLAACAGLWPLDAVRADAGAELVHDVAERLPGVHAGPYEECPREAFVMPIALPGEAHASFVLVAGVSARLPLSDAHRSFFALLGAAVSTVLAHATAVETERRRADALAELDRAKTAFFSNISHEFRTPLTLLLGPLEDELHEREAPLPAARLERLGVAHRNSLRLLKLVNTLLDFSRIEAGRAQIDYQPTELAALTAELAGNFRSACERAGIGLDVRCAALSEPVLVDRDMWEKIVLNLISNAFKFTHAGTVSVTLRELARVAELVVEDTGVGIPAAELPHVFDRFYRVKGTQGRSHEGTGIGLALVRELVALHGGTITVESEPGRGTRFVVRIPFERGRSESTPPRTDAAQSTALGAKPFVAELLHLADRDRAPAPLPVTSAASAAVPLAEAPARPRIVWADDNADMRRYVERLLGDRYDVEAVADGERALAAIRRARPELVLSDVMMPRLDGFGLLRAIRDESALRDIPVILMSARAGEEAYLEGLAAGADDYLVKPFTARELSSRVASRLELSKLRGEAEAARLRAERAELEAAHAAENERRFRQLAEALPQLVWTTEPDGTCDYLSKQWVAYTGIAAEPQLGHGWVSRIHPEDRAELLTAWSAAVARGYEFRCECRIQSASGSYRWFDTRAIPVRGPDGALLKWVGATTDIEELKRSHELLGRAQRMEALGRLAGGVAHDFNNLLMAIAGNNQLALTELPTHHPVRRKLEEVASACLRAGELVRRILTFSRQQSPERAPMGVADVVAEALRLARASLPAGVELSAELPAELPPVLLSASELHQIVMNLVTNAAHAAVEGRPARISVRLEALTASAELRRSVPGSGGGRYVVLSVRDNGRGIPKDALTRIFDPFFTTKPVGEGTGLGLAIIQGIMESCGGFVLADSTLGEHTLFRLYFPVAEGAQVALSPAPAAARIARAVHGRVLFVDDQPALVLLGTQMLKRLGCQAEGCTSALEAIARLRADPGAFDCVITDASMPGMTGLELAEEVCAVSPGLPLIMLTGHCDDEDAAAAQRLGVREVLLKPCGLEELASALSRVLALRPAPARAAHG